MIFNMCFDGTLFPTTFYCSSGYRLFIFLTFHASGLHLVSLFPLKSRASSSGPMRPGSVPWRIVMGYGISFFTFPICLTLALFPHVSRCLAFHGPIACTTVLSFFFFLPGGCFYPLILFPDIAFGSSFDCLQRLEDRGWFSHGLMYVKTSLP
jgi:hypothetical protein